MMFVAFVLITIQIVVTHSKILPDGLSLNLCHRSDSDIKSCLAKQFDITLHDIVSNGLKKYNVPKMDPLEIPFLIFERTGDDLTSIKGTVKHLRIVGLSNFALTDTKYQEDRENIIAEVEVSHPHVYITFEMDIAGKLLGAPVNIAGNVGVNVTDITTRVQGGLQTIAKRGIKYFTLNDIKVKSNVGGGHILLDSDTSEYQSIIDFGINAFNSNPKPYIDFVHPFFAETAENFLGSELEKILSAIPAENLLPE